MTTTSDAKEMMARLIAFDTTSDKPNLDLIANVKDYLEGLGVECHLTPDDDGEKASLFATIGPRDKPGIALSGHTDCVPVEGQPWDTNPFEMTEKDGRLYGRGTCDMKGYVAMCLAMVPAFLEKPLATPIHLALSYDEEVGCTGVRPMIERLGRDLPMPSAVLVGEPTMMEVVDAHKGLCDFKTIITGFEAHSSMDVAGGNSIFAASRFLGELMRLREVYVEKGDPTGRFTPGYSSVHVGLISGGSASNIVPRHCEIDWEVRMVRSEDARDIAAAATRYADEHIVPGLKAVSEATGIETIEILESPPLTPDPGSHAEVLAKRLAGSNATGAVSYATEAGLFQQSGLPTIVCGPGSVEQAHKPNEYLAVSQIDSCMAFLHRLKDACRTGVYDQALFADFAIVKIIDARTEFAGHRDASVVLTHAFAIILREAFQHLAHTVARTAAFLDHRHGIKHPHATLMIQPEQQLLTADTWIRQFVILNSFGKRTCFTPGVIFLLGSNVLHEFVGCIAGMKVG